MTPSPLWFPFAAAACSLLLPPAAAQTGVPRLDAEGTIGLVASFDDGFAADLAGGDPRPAAHGGLDQTTPGREGRGLRLQPNEFFRFGVPGNLSMEEGTLTLWVAPDAGFTPGQPAAGPERQQLFAIDDRLKLRLGAELNHEKPDAPMLMFQAGDGEKTYRFGTPLDAWPAGEWRRVQVSWKRPSTAAIRVGDGLWAERDIVPLPGLPDEMAMDLYLGTNAVQLERSPVGKILPLEGTLDDLTIGPKYRDDSVPQDLVDTQKPAETLPLAWAAEMSRRIQLDLQDGKRPTEDLRRPVRAILSPGVGWAEQTPAQRRAALRSLRVVQQDPDTGEAVARPDDGGLFHPFRVHEDAYSDAELDLRFVHEGSLPARYAVYFDPAADESTEAAPREAVSVGNGDRLLVGVPGSTATLNGGLRGNHEPFDPDGDGDTDFWFAFGDQIGTGDNMSNGHFFYENVGGPGHDAVFAPPVLIRRGHTPVGELKANMSPQLVDVNGDGKTDCFLYGGGNPSQWWEWSFRDGRVVVDAIHELELPDLGKAERGQLLDWNGDGRLDLLSGNEVRYGKQSPGEPLRIGERADLTLDVGSIPADGWQSSPLSLLPLDYDGDGVRDLLASGWQTRLFLHRGLRGGGGTVFGEGERLVTFDGHELVMPSVFPVARMVDFDNDGDEDLTWTNEGAMLGWCENIAAPGEAPMLRQTAFFRQEDAPVNANAISIASVHDWDGDGDGDLILGTSAATVYLSENVGDAQHPVWDESRPMRAADMPIELRSGERGSLLGAQESDWGYTNPVAADWDGDGLDDLLVSGIRGEVTFFRNVGEAGRPQLASGRRLEVHAEIENPPFPAWTRFPQQGRELIIAHRCRPAVYDWNGDGQLDLLTLDHESRWAVYLGRRNDGGVPTVGLPVHDALEFDNPYALAQIWNRRPLDHPGWRAHYAGRTVAELTDWDGDGDPDLILDSVNARYYENVTGDPASGAAGTVRFVDRGEMASAHLVKHNSGPGTGDLTGDGRADLVVGAQSGRTFFFSREFLEGESPSVRAAEPEERPER